MVANLGRDLARAVDAAEVLDRQHRRQARPTPCCGQGLELGAGEDTPAYPSAVTILEGIEARPQGASQREGVGLEPTPHFGMCLGLIALEGQEIVATTADDLRGDRGSAGEGIQADQAIAQVQAGPHPWEW